MRLIFKIKMRSNYISTAEYVMKTTCKQDKNCVQFLTEALSAAVHQTRQSNAAETDQSSDHLLQSQQARVKDHQGLSISELPHNPRTRLSTLVLAAFT